MLLMRSNMACRKEVMLVVVVGGGLCADIHGQVNGLGNRYIFFFPLEFSD